MNGTTTVDYRAITNVEQLQTVNTESLFKPERYPQHSPIDQFVKNTNTLNTIYLPDSSGQVWLPELGNLILLGYMSAIESFVRAIISGLINIDPVVRKDCGAKTISFALATNYRDQTLLPEALMENMAFSSAGVIEKALKDFLGIKQISDDLKKSIAEFNKLCQIRHCCVHRFGKLGSQNAMELGFDNHRQIIEHPFSPSKQDVIAIADALQIFVRSLNNFLFTQTLDRIAKYSVPSNLEIPFSWHYGRDRHRFLHYYNLFAIKLSQPISGPAKAIYDSYRAEHAAMVRARRSRDRA